MTVQSLLGKKLSEELSACKISVCLGSVYPPQPSFLIRAFDTCVKPKTLMCFAWILCYKHQLKLESHVFVWIIECLFFKSAAIYNHIAYRNVTLQIQNEGCYLQSGAKDALLNALLVAAKRFSSGPHQVL